MLKQTLWRYHFFKTLLKRCFFFFFCHRDVFKCKGVNLIRSPFTHLQFASERILSCRPTFVLWFISPHLAQNSPVIYFCSVRGHGLIFLYFPTCEELFWPNLSFSRQFVMPLYSFHLTFDWFPVNLGFLLQCFFFAQVSLWLHYFVLKMFW